jgi:hypothetical protein
MTAGPRPDGGEVALTCKLGTAGKVAARTPPFFVTCVS